MGRSLHNRLSDRPEEIQRIGLYLPRVAAAGQFGIQRNPHWRTSALACRLSSSTSMVFTLALIHVSTINAQKVIYHPLRLSQILRPPI